MNKLHLKVVTPEKVLYDREVDEVYLPTPSGEIGVLPHHINLMSLIKPGELRIRDNNKEEILATGGGILQMVDNILTVAIDLAEKAEDIDEKVVMEVKERAEKALHETQSNEEYAVALVNLEKALAKLKVKRRHSRAH